MPTQPGDKPNKEVTITNCGELTGEEAEAASHKMPDSTGDPYEDFPEDQTSTPSATEIVKIATDLKEFGNSAFKAGKLSLGLDKYQKGLRYLNEEPSLDNEPLETKQKLESLRFTLNSNSALLANKLRDYTEAQRHASAALDVASISEADKAKALFRRGVARIGLKNDDEALLDLEEAKKLAPKDAAILSELTNLKKGIAERAKKEKAAYSKFFS